MPEPLVLRIADGAHSAVNPRAVGERLGADLREESARLLARGLTQRAIAGRMGLSERTVAGHIARLRELYDAQTLFQPGRRMRGARTGESGG
ncbi:MULTISPECIES: helix-turn-helix domain-containing protein [Streptomyces]|uniref:helix-turn-helix domain-containing protein n=1 Tax=Streptomyces TaxID=1883 RepID=UPI000AC0954C|nr:MULTISPECIES: helix-turn-helix domain-containing protein [Streptomyces]